MIFLTSGDVCDKQGNYIAVDNNDYDKVVIPGTGWFLKGRIMPQIDEQPVTWKYVDDDINNATGVFIGNKSTRKFQ